MEEHRLWTLDSSVREAYSEDASGLIGLPDAVARPETEEQVVEIVRCCHARKIPLTAQGLRSSTVGGPLAMGGVAISMERMNRVIEIDTKRRLAIVEPGVVLGEFKKPLREQGLFYPPDPTSEDECSVGGTVGANASGARTYRYGPTRRWVRGLRVVLADGTVTEVVRREVEKNVAGFYAFQDPVDLFIGSEGTLGIVTRVTFDLLPAPPGFFSGMAFFRNIGDTILFVLAADRARAEGRLQPRCLELFDDASLDLIRPEAGKLRIPTEARGAIFFEQECEPGNEEDALTAWLAELEKGRGVADETIVAANEEQHLALRKLRHALPSTMNERGKQARAKGGMKLGTDWAVPLRELPQAVDDASHIVRELFDGLVIRYGHVGNGHPHFNLLAEDPASLEKAREATHRMAMMAVERGGTVTAEHGVGKIKREYLRYQYPSWILSGMRAVKASLDPLGILAPGNIFGD